MPRINFKTIIVLLVIIEFLILSDFALAKDIIFEPQVGIPGGKIGTTTIAPGAAIPVTPTTFAHYLNAFYNWAIGAIIVIGIVMIIFGGFQWMAAGGNATKITAAKERIFSALLGILLAVGSYTLLNLINPSLVRLESLSLTKIKKEESGGMLLGGGKCGSEGEGLPSCEGSCGGIETAGIKSSQCQDASPTLTLFLQCLFLYNQVAENRLQLIITSISDDAGLAKCRDSFNSNICAHERNSAHYGYGTEINGSYAADFRFFEEPKYKGNLKALTRTCSGLFLDETGGGVKHYHLSVKVDDFAKIAEKIKLVEISTCAEAKDSGQCQKISSICQWDNNQCKVRQKCGLDEGEKRAAGKYVYCCCARDVGVNCKYVSSMPVIGLGQKVCDICGGGFPYEWGSTNCEQYPYLP